MRPKFPSPEWLNALSDKLNNDSRYASIASKWEADMTIIVEPGGELKDPLYYYFDLWHGKCRRVAVLNDPEEEKPVFVLTASYENISKIMKGELDPMQAMLTRKMKVQGNLVVMMRNVPTVLDFVRCAREVTDEIE
jgi:putative sterol carrier protein